MKLTSRTAMVLILSAAILLTVANPSWCQVWWEETGKKYEYDLSPYCILILLGDDFDYHETVVVKKHWEDWGASVDIAGTDTQLTGHLWKKTPKGWDRSEERQIQTDLLLSQVELSHYQALFFPGGNSPKHLLEKDSLRLVQMIREADHEGLLLAGICHGPQALAAAGVVGGRKVTGHRDIAEGVVAAGGEYVTEVCVVDGNLITGNWPYFETIALKVARKLLYPHGEYSEEKSAFEDNPVLKTIKERRSIRRFQERDVDPETIDQILTAATWAPSASNEQPWKFVVVRDRQTKARIVESLAARLTEDDDTPQDRLDRLRTHWSSLFAAPVHIFAFAHVQDSGEKTEEKWQDIVMLFEMQGVTLACQNILLSAKALGLGSLWMGAPLAVEDDIKALLRVPDDARLATVIAIGYPVDEPLPPVRRPLSEVRFFEKWPE